MAAEPQQNALYQKTQGQNLKKWKIQKTIKKDRKWKFWSFFWTSLVWGHVVLMITAQKCNIKMKKCKILPFQNHQFNKNSVFGPFFVDYPLLPADMINFLLYTVSAISFAPEKVVRTWGEPQKKSFFTNIWSLSQICQKQGWAPKNDP